MPTENQVKVSIGLPVYQGEEFLQEAIESVLNQTYGDFELIISDNGSTDNTAKISQEYAKKDKRIKFFQHPKNMGAAFNFNYVLEKAKGEFFKWHASDDLIEPDFIKKTVESLKKNPDAVLSFTKIKLIEFDGALRDYQEIPVNYSAKNPVTRFKSHIETDYVALEIFGLIRKKALLETKGMLPLANGDGILVGELSLKGRFVEVPEYYFSNRSQKNRSVSTCQSQAAWNTWFDPNRKALPPPFLYFEVPWQRVCSIFRTKLSMIEKIQCVFVLLFHAKYSIYFQKLRKEVASLFSYKE